MVAASRGWLTMGSLHPSGFGHQLFTLVVCTHSPSAHLPDLQAQNNPSAPLSPLKFRAGVSPQMLTARGGFSGPRLAGSFCPSSCPAFFGSDKLTVLGGAEGEAAQQRS